MKNLKNALRIGALVLALVLVLAACGGGAVLEGTYVYEDGTPGTWTFTDDSFVASIPNSELGLDRPGDFSIRGTFTVDEDAETINLTVDENALRTDALQLT